MSEKVSLLQQRERGYILNALVDLFHHSGREAVLERTCTTETMNERSRLAWTTLAEITVHAELKQLHYHADMMFHILSFYHSSVLLTTMTQCNKTIILHKV